MKEIDWSKAPEGATHYDTDFDLFCNENGYWRPSGIWVSDNKQNEWGTHRYVARPVAWTGEGLPPVGAACEVKNYINDGWDRVDEVLAHTTIKGAVVAVFKCDDRVFYSPADAFRPIRTPEQIAAEEREKEVDALCYDIVSHYEAPKMSEHYLGLAKALHAAGYRKVTP